MSIIELWMTQDWVVKTLIVAWIITTILILEKGYALLMASRGLKRIEQGIFQNNIDAIMTFQGENDALFNAHVGIQLEKVDLFLNRYLGYIGLVAVLSPMLGLIGTFFGVWHVFQGVGNFGLNDASVIARGIKEVLIDTMAGLIVAVYATIFYKLYALWARKLSITFEEKLYHLLKEHHASR